MLELSTAICFLVCDIWYVLFLVFVSYPSSHLLTNFVTEVLPLIEFQLEDGITDDEAMRLLQSSNESVTKPKPNHADSNFQALLIEDPAQSVSDLFTATLINLEVRQVNASSSYQYK